MLKRLLLFAWVGVMAVLISSCEGSQGEVGPAGPKGDTGAQGPAGPAGQDGQGTGGGGLIISSGAAETDSTGGFFAALGNLTAEQDSLLQNSAVLVYLKSGGGYWPLPGIVFFGQAYSQFTFVHGVAESTFFVDIFQFDWSETSTTRPTRQVEDVRIVIVPSEVISRMNAETLKSYEKTIEAVGLTNAKIQTVSKVNIKRPVRK